MSKKTSQCSVEDLAEHNRPLSQYQVDQSKAAMDGRKKADLDQRNGDTASSSPEGGSLNGDVKRGGKCRRRKKRSSNPENCPVGKVEKVKNEEKADKLIGQVSNQYDVLMGLKSECSNVWFERSLYDRAENLYQCWLATSSKGTSQLTRSPQSSGKYSNSPSTMAPSSLGPACYHGNQVACHHVVQEVWVNKTTFDQAEHRFVEGSVQPSVPNSLDLLLPPNRSTSSRTPDEGYQSLAPTPATPVIQQAAVTPATRQSINGLPRIPVELLRDVWLDKPLYDHAEAVFYQNLYGNNSSKRSGCTSRSSDHPQSLVEEEEEEEDEELVVEEKRVVLQGKAEVFHALLPIQEEEELAETRDKEEASGVSHFLHPDSERVWLDKWRYEAAETRFYGYSVDKACMVKRDWRSEASSIPSKDPRDKYDQTGKIELLQTFQFIFGFLLTIICFPHSECVLLCLQFALCFHMPWFVHSLHFMVCFNFPE